MLEVTHLHSLVGTNYEALVTERPFRAPHHSASHVSIIGGGTLTRPGEITLSHRGVLFLDELPEFSRSTLEALRQPLEDKVVTIARSKQTVQYPADFILVATANPCPCGFYGSSRECRCTMAQIQRYQQKISGPIADRFDLFVHVQTIDHSKLLQTPSAHDKNKKLLSQIEQAQKQQRQRFKSNESNATMSNQELRRFAQLTTDSISLLSTAAQRLQLSARGYMRVIKVARTIADLEGNTGVLPAHISEALQYRKPVLN